MRGIDVVLFVERVSRELHVACAVKYFAERHHQLQLEILPWPSGVPEALRTLRPRVVMLPYCYVLSNLFTDMLMDWRRSVYFNLMWEQLLSVSTLQSKMPQGEFPRKHVIHHAWSESFADHLRNQGIPAGHIFLNGNPAYTLYDEPYRSYFGRRADLAQEYRLDPTKRWVFFPENYAWAFHSDSVVAEFVSRGMDPDDAAELREFSRHSLQEALRWCHAVASGSGVELIVRPRPGVGSRFVTAAREILSTVPPGLHFIQDGTVREWILASDVVLSSHSTSLVEAALADKPAYIVEPRAMPRSLYTDWYDAAPHITTQREFEEVCFDGKSVARSSQLSAWARGTMMTRGDAIWNIAAFLAGIINGSLVKPAPAPRRMVRSPSRLPAPAWLLYEYRRLRWRNRRWAPRPTPPAYLEDLLDLAEIERVTDRWSHILAGYRPAHITGGTQNARSLVVQGS